MTSQRKKVTEDQVIMLRVLFDNETAMYRLIADIPDDLASRKVVLFGLVLMDFAALGKYLLRLGINLVGATDKVSAIELD